MARLFLALGLPQKVRARLAEEADRLRLAGAKVSWVKPDLYHVTVRFLGEVQDQELLALDPLLRDAAVEVGPLRLVARGLGAFPEHGAPRVVWCGTEGVDADQEASLQHLKRAVDERLRAAGWRHEKGPYRPHITLGRARSPLNAEALRERMGPAVRREFGHFDARELVLYESTRSREGATYEALQLFALGGG